MNYYFINFSFSLCFFIKTSAHTLAKLGFSEQVFIIASGLFDSSYIQNHHSSHRYFELLKNY